MSRAFFRPFPAALLISAIVLGIPTTGLGKDDDDKDRRLKADPFVFIGDAAECGGVAGSNIVTAAWLGGAGLPDNGGANTTAADLATNPNKRDRHRGLLLSKNGPTADCSAAGAEIKGVKGMVVTPTFELGFDYRNGGHCGAGAPRFNVSYIVPSGSEGFSFVGGCSNDSTPTPAPQDPLQWSRVRFQTSSPTESFPVIPAGSKIESITLIFDEGTDTPTAARPSGDAGNPAGIGLTVLDNIFINGRVIRSGNHIEPKHGDGDRDD
jgi:hypothetical protein